MSTFLPKSPRDIAKDFTRTKYLRFKEGMPVVVRILDESAHLLIKHWIPRAEVGVLCLEDKCPICDSNAKIRTEHPTDYKKIRGYIPQQFRYVVNVLDRTPVIRDPETGEEYYAHKGKFPTVSSDGERSLVNIEPAPSNTVKIMERGRQLFEQIAVLHDDAQQEHGMEITGFDIKFTTLGQGQSMIITPVPVYDNNDDVSSILEENELETTPLTTLGIQLSPDEMIKLLNGISLRDLYASRREDSVSEVDESIASSLADVSERVVELFDEEE